MIFKCIAFLTNDVARQVHLMQARHQFWDSHLMRRLELHCINGFSSLVSHSMYTKLVSTTIPLPWSARPPWVLRRPSDLSGNRCLLGRLGVLESHLLYTVLQRGFCAVIEYDSTLDAKLISKSFIVSQRLNDLFDKIIHCFSLEISQGCFGINRPILNVRGDVI